MIARSQVRFVATQDLRSVEAVVCRLKHIEVVMQGLLHDRFAIAQSDMLTSYQTRLLFLQLSGP